MQSRPGIVHRYPDRVLFIVTHMCNVLQTAKKKNGGRRMSLFPKPKWIPNRIYRKNPANKGCPDIGRRSSYFVDAVLEKIISRLRAIKHVEYRIGTRTPVTLPMQITKELADMLKKYQPIWINTHFNHPREITPSLSRPALLIVDAGIPRKSKRTVAKCQRQYRHYEELL